MVSYSTIGIGIAVVAAGWMVGKMMVGFADFVVESIKNQDRDHD